MKRHYTPHSDPDVRRLFVRVRQLEDRVAVLEMQLQNRHTLAHSVRRFRVACRHLVHVVAEEAGVFRLLNRLSR
jgi:hypothetical protein